MRVNRPRGSRSDDSVDPVTDADSADTASLERLETRLVGIGPPDTGPILSVVPTVVPRSSSLRPYNWIAEEVATRPVIDGAVGSEPTT